MFRGIGTPSLIIRVRTVKLEYVLGKVFTYYTERTLETKEHFKNNDACYYLENRIIEYYVHSQRMPEGSNEGVASRAKIIEAGRL